jgi:hypothetical protein
MIGQLVCVFVVLMMTDSRIVVVWCIVVCQAVTTGAPHRLPGEPTLPQPCTVAIVFLTSWLSSPCSLRSCEQSSKALAVRRILCEVQQYRYCNPGLLEAVTATFVLHAWLTSSKATAI